MIKRLLLLAFLLLPALACGQLKFGQPTSNPSLAASCSFSTNALGGEEAVCTNTNTGTTVMCVTVDGSNPRSNLDGATCGNGWVLAGLNIGGVTKGFFDFNITTTVNIVANSSGLSDSPITTYTVTLPQQVILSTNFGFQCGPGQVKNCQGAGNAIVWPTSTALPDMMRLHDSKTEWSVMQPTATTDFVTATYDSYLDNIATHQPLTVAQTFTAFPCWAQTQPYTCPNTIANYGANTNLFPSDLTSTGSPSFNAFVTKFVQHCTTAGHCTKDYVKVYEMWNEADLGVHMAVPNLGCTTLTGCFAQLLNMIRPAVQIIRNNVPNAVIAMPSMTSFSSSYTTDLTNWLNLENSSGRISDVVDWHIYLSASGGTTVTPEVQWTNFVSTPTTGFLAQQNVPGWVATPWIDSETNFSSATNYACPFQGTIYQTTLGAGGSGYALGDTFNVVQSGGSGGQGIVSGVSGGAVTSFVIQANGTGYTAASGVATSAITGSGTGLTINFTTGPYTETDCAGQLARLQLLHDSYSSSGDYWYYWNTTIGNGPTTPTSYQTVYLNEQNLLEGGYFTAIPTVSGGTPPTITAPFVESNATLALWVWSTCPAGGSYSSCSAGINYTVPSGYVDYKDLLGNTTTVIGGQVINIGVMPIMLEQ